MRVVNGVDLMTLFPREFHPHGMNETRFVELFTADKPIVFAFHGYQRAIHEIVHGRVNVERFHVRGFNEQGTTTTPFDMVILNGMSRYHLAAEALRRSPRVIDVSDVAADVQRLRDMNGAAMDIWTLVSITLAGCLIFGVVYTHPRIAPATPLRDPTTPRAPGLPPLAAPAPCTAGHALTALPGTPPGARARRKHQATAGPRRPPNGWRFTAALVVVLEVSI